MSSYLPPNQRTIDQYSTSNIPQELLQKLQGLQHVWYYKDPNYFKIDLMVKRETEEKYMMLVSVFLQEQRSVHTRSFKPGDATSFRRIQK